MKQEVLHQGDHKPEIHHFNPRRMAAKFETYVAMAMVAAGAVLMIVLAYGIMNTGSGTPAWMR